MKDTFLMSSCQCDLNHSHDAQCLYGIAWALNPHTRVGEACPLKAQYEHGSLRETLLEMGAQIEMLPFIPGAYDSVFIKDNGVLFAKGDERFCVIGKFLHPERAVEEDRRASEFAARGFTVIHRPESRFEGGDFVYDPKSRNGFLGYGIRSEFSSADVLAETLGVRVIPLELVDPWLYHLDMAMNVLFDGTALACREAFSPKSWALLQDLFGPDRLLEVPREVALRFSLNWVQTEKGIVHSRRQESSFADFFRQRGLRSRPVDLSQFEAAGGSAACLVNRIWFLN